MENISRFNSVLIGGWATYFLVNENFKKERYSNYIGSKDIDFGVLSEDLNKVFGVVEKLGFFSVSFRYCKIYSISEKKFLSESESSSYPVHDLFYLFLDFITDKRLNVESTIFQDELIKFMFDNKLFVEKNGIRVIMQELLVLSKLRITRQRSEEKRMKDLIDAMMVFSFCEEFKNKFFKELTEKFRFDRNFIRKELEKVDEYLKMLGFSTEEISNLKISFTGSILK